MVRRETNSRRTFRGRILNMLRGPMIFNVVNGPTPEFFVNGSALFDPPPTPPGHGTLSRRAQSYRTNQTMCRLAHWQGDRSTVGLSLGGKPVGPCSRTFCVAC